VRHPLGSLPLQVRRDQFPCLVRPARPQSVAAPAPGTRLDGHRFLVGRGPPGLATPPTLALVASDRARAPDPPGVIRVRGGARARQARRRMAQLAGTPPPPGHPEREPIAGGAPRRVAESRRRPLPRLPSERGRGPAGPRRVDRPPDCPWHARTETG